MTTVRHTVPSGADEEAPRPLRKDAIRNRAALVESARAVFAEHGLDASMDDIARHAGVGVGTAYRHFANKYELAEAVFTREIDGVVARAEDAAGAADGWTGLVEFLSGIAAQQCTDRGLREVMMGMRPGDDVSDEINTRLAKPLTTLLGRAKADGTVAEHVEVSDIGVVMMMLCGVADLTGEVAPDLWRRYLPMLLAGLHPSSASPAVPAVDDQTLRTAIKSYKQRMQRVHAPR